MDTTRTYSLMILEILKEYSDKDHILSMEQIQRKLKDIYQVELNRKTVGAYIQALQDANIEINTYQKNRKGYYLSERNFEKSEVHVLCNLIHSSHFICANYSEELIQKLLSTQSRYARKEFRDAVYIQNLRKTRNQDLFLNVDILLDAIKQKCMISMEYLTYNLQKQLVPKREKRYELHPYYIVEENENLYLLACTSHHGNITHYRIDRMREIKIMDTPQRRLKNSFDPYEYTKTKLYMYAGDPVRVTLRCHSLILNDIIDQFGQEVILQNDKEADHFLAVITSSRQGIIYYAMQYTKYCEVLLPNDLRNEVMDNLKKGYEQYI